MTTAVFGTVMTSMVTHYSDKRSIFQHTATLW